MGHAPHCVGARAVAGLAAAVLMFGLSASAIGAEELIGVDWANPEIKAFLDDRAANPPQMLGPAEGSKLAKLKLPVLGFDAVPGLVAAMPSAGPQAAPERTVSIDEDNPVWYQIVDSYPGVTVSVSADLRVQHEFPADYPVYATREPGAAPSAGPQVSVFDEETGGEGVEGYIAEYTIYKYPNIPYTVTVECTAETKEQCKNTDLISKDSSLLRLIEAQPPR